MIEENSAWHVAGSGLKKKKKLIMSSVCMNADFAFILLV